MLPFFTTAGHRCTTGFFPRNPLSRFWYYRRLSAYDVIFIQKRTLSRAELLLVRQLAPTIIFDIDDAVMFDGEGAPDRRRQSRFDAMMRAADLVICGNGFLAEHAAVQHARTEIIPTAIDTKRFQPGLCDKSKATLVTIGWTGSRSTNPYLNEIFPILANFAGRAELKVMSDTTDGLDFARLGNLPHRFVKWSAATEVAETAEFDIGLMPLPDNNQTRGKCGCKALQYMALGQPAVCSPVGVNRDIIHDGDDGFLPQTDREWHDTLSVLIDNEQLRKRVGAKGRLTAESRFALHRVARQLIAAVERTVTKRRAA